MGFFVYLYDMNIFSDTFERHKKLLFEFLNPTDWEETADWEIFNTPVDTSRSFEKEMEYVTEILSNLKILVDSRPTKEFWEMYDALPEHVKKVSKLKFQLFLKNPFDPSLHFKPLKQINRKYWSVDINANYRAIAYRYDATNQISLKWIFIGNHSQYQDYYTNLS
jgi:mRNA-degrading endonuclease RelE of RelBE toxin-antitoxin system